MGNVKMSKKRRNTFQIFAEILKIGRNGVKKSHIVYRANLNFNTFNKYLESLKTAGLMIGPTSGSGVYKTTEKGVKYLNNFETYPKVSIIKYSSQ
jgi:predicted transcriptional regulator